MLIKELMDSVDFESDHTGTTLTMVKKRKQMNKVTKIDSRRCASHCNRRIFK